MLLREQRDKATALSATIRDHRRSRRSVTTIHTTTVSFALHQVSLFKFCSARCTGEVYQLDPTSAVASGQRLRGGSEIYMVYTRTDLMIDSMSKHGQSCGWRAEYTRVYLAQELSKQAPKSCSVCMDVCICVHISRTKTHLAG